MAYNYWPIIVVTCIAVSCVGGSDSGFSKNADESIQQEKQTLVKSLPIDTAYFTNLLVGKLKYDVDTNFVLVKAEHSKKQIFLEGETYAAFQRMYDAAKLDGVSLMVISGARNFEYQKGIWERKWRSFSKTYSGIEKAENILRYSSMPGTSRHHWGTDLDLNSLENSYFESGRGLAEFEWLSQNAQKFGFCQVYTSKQETGRTGYEMEKWHWSYMPLAHRYLKLYKGLISYDDINGFAGSELAQKLNVIDDYVFGVSYFQSER